MKIQAKSWKELREGERETYGGRKELAFVQFEEVGMVVGGSEGRE
jgi:hypothetical protein